MKKRLLGVLAACVTLSMAGTARADILTLGGDTDASYNYHGDQCTDCSASATFELLSNNQIKITLTNTSGQLDNNWLTQLLVDTVPAIDITAANFDQAGWTFSNNTGSQWVFGVDTTNGVNNALDQNETLVATLTFTPTTNTLEIVNSQVHWQNTDNAADSDKGTGTPGEDPLTPVPEPGSMVLLGSGLMAAARAFRRSRSAVRVAA